MYSWAPLYVWDACMQITAYMKLDVQYRQVSFYVRTTFLKNVAQIEHRNFHLKRLISWGLRISSYMVYKYTTSGRTESKFDSGRN